VFARESFPCGPRHLYRHRCPYRRHSSTKPARGHCQAAAAAAPPPDADAMGTMGTCSRLCQVRSKTTVGAVVWLPLTSFGGAYRALVGTPLVLALDLDTRSFSPLIHTSAPLLAVLVFLPRDFVPVRISRPPSRARNVCPFSIAPLLDIGRWSPPSTARSDRVVSSQFPTLLAGFSPS